jgi:glycosyltransferase involved in cell wall biosynthesis
MHWIILTGEYPPQTGGVSDYAFALAQGLAELGDRVEVFAPAGQGVELATGRVEVKRLPDHFGWRSFRRLRHIFRSSPPDTTVLIQYVPHAYGWKAMNLPFAFWIWTNRRRRKIWAFFHEVAYPIEDRQSLRHRIIAVVTRFMAGLVARASARIYVSIPAWEKILREVAPIIVPIVWMPIPSNVPGAADLIEVEKVRLALARPAAGIVVGHFGTFGSHIALLLEQLLPALLLSFPEIVILLIGRGSNNFAARLGRSHGSFTPRVHVSGDLPPKALASRVRACDLLVQPYPDGVSSRRTTVMTGLALGVPVVTNKGHLTEPFWQESGAVSLANSFDVGTFVELVEDLVADEQARQRLGKRGRTLYNANFDISRTLNQLRTDALQERNVTPG